jgi:hypothetical protein
MMAAGEKLGNVAGKLGKTIGKMGREAEKLGKMVGKLGTAIRKMGTGAFALGRAAGKMGIGVVKLGTARGELGTVLRNWGIRPEKRAADGSRPVWGIKFLRSGCEPFARWLSRRLPTVPRSLMECALIFLGAANGRQVLFEQFFRRIESGGCQFSSADGALTFNLWRTSR